MKNSSYSDWLRYMLTPNDYRLSHSLTIFCHNYIVHVVLSEKMSFFNIHNNAIMTFSQYISLIYSWYTVCYISSEQ